MTTALTILAMVAAWALLLSFTVWAFITRTNSPVRKSFRRMYER